METACSPSGSILILHTTSATRLDLTPFKVSFDLTHAMVSPLSAFNVKLSNHPILREPLHF